MHDYPDRGQSNFAEVMRRDPSHDLAAWLDQPILGEASDEYPLLDEEPTDQVRARHWRRIYLRMAIGWASGVFLAMIAWALWTSL